VHDFERRYKSGFYILGKTIRSTGKMDKYNSPLHIVSSSVFEKITLRGNFFYLVLL